MKKMLITGGTVFVSRFAASYFADKYDVYVLNRNSREQCSGVTLIEGDRHALKDRLKPYRFDVILDITAYDEYDILDLINELSDVKTYVMISSSAVYPESAPQPFSENSIVSMNHIWGKYSSDKIAAEAALLSHVPNAYIIRPPYLYGPMNNVYRESFVFDCVMQNKPCYIPENGNMKLQFFHVEDLCRFIEQIIVQKPEQHIFNVGNKEMLSIKQWVSICYHAAGNEPEFISVDRAIPQRNYFPFHNYEYCLDVSQQYMIMDNVKPMEVGLKESFEWYRHNENAVIKKPFFQYIKENIEEKGGQDH